jgi:hypothetical protein
MEIDGGSARPDLGVGRENWVGGMSMQRTRFAVGAVILTAAAGSALAADPSRIIFTDDTMGGGASNAIRSYQDGVVTTHVTFGATTRLADIAKGRPGEYFFGNGPFPPVDPSQADVRRVTDLFGVASVATVTSSNPTFNPIGGEYDPRADRYIQINNVGGGFGFGATDGIYAINPSTGSPTLLVAEPPTGSPRPRWSGGGYITQDPMGAAGSFYAVATTGGRYVNPNGPPPPPPNQNVSSVVYRVDVNASGTAATITELFDTFIIRNDTGGTIVTDVRGITQKPGQNSIWVTDQLTDSIWRIDIDGTGAYSGITQVVTGLDNPEVIQYDPYSDTLVFAQHGATNALSRINLDGTGLTNLTTGVHIRGLEIIPTPGITSLLGLAGLLATRRRRA